MKSPCFLSFSDALAAALCFICALSLQIQITLFSSPTYLGLRVNLTDLITPLAGMAILVTLLIRQSRWPEWNMKHVYFWLAGITLTLIAAFINTWISYDEISRWALTNKLGGWIILMAIMGMGAWIGTNARREHIQLFFKTFLSLALAILFYTLVVIVLRSYPTTAEWFPRDPYAFFPIDGLMANRNAYGFLMLAVFAFSSIFYFSQTDGIYRKICYAFYFLLPMFLVFNGSRATLLALGLIIPAMFLLNIRQGKKCLHLLLCIILGLATVFAIYHDKKDKLLILKLKQTEFLMEAAEAENSASLSEIGENVKYPGDSMRLTILQDALEMVRNHPIIGSGLGSMMIYQKEKHGRMINIIDCTPLWIFVEMGAIGLAVFALFYWQVIKSFWAERKAGDSFTQAFYTAILIIIFGFTFMCLFHEIMYTRHMWFLIGLGLALKTRPNECTV